MKELNLTLDDMTMEEFVEISRKAKQCNMKTEFRDNDIIYQAEVNGKLYERVVDRIVYYKYIKEVNIDKED